jgi:hypothetical protein
VGDNRRAVVEELLRAGADPNLRPPTPFGQDKGKAALEVARGNGNVGLVALLEQAAAGVLPPSPTARPVVTAAYVPVLWARIERAIKPLADVTPHTPGRRQRS